MKVKKGKNKGHRSISKVKRSNQKRNKLVKHGKAKPNSTPRYIPNKKKEERGRNDRVKKPEQLEEEKKQKEHQKKEDDDEAYEELADSVSAEDAAFIVQTMGKGQKRKRGQVEENENESSENEDDDVAIHEYEKLALQRMQSEKQRSKNVKLMLPIKTKEGLKGRSIELEEELDSDNDEKEEPTQAPVDGDDEDDDTELVEGGTEVSVVELYARRQELLSERKVTIGSLAVNFLEAPEERIINLEKLVKLVDGAQPKPIELTVHRLAAASVLEILKDVTPGYKIHHPELKANEKPEERYAEIAKV